jgi:hypothetical protein
MAIGDRIPARTDLLTNSPRRHGHLSSRLHLKGRLTMTHYGRLADYQFGDKADDIRGATVYGNGDEKLGKIDDVIFDHSTGEISYVIVDTGGWLSSKRFVVPPQRLSSSTSHDGDFTADLTKDQIQQFPEYDEKDLDSSDKWSNYENRYRAKWEEHPVMHRAETDRNITPTTLQYEGNQSSLEAEARASQARADAEDVRLNDRWSRFQAHVRDRRRTVTTGCHTCTEDPSFTKGSESAQQSEDPQRKAG